MLRPTLLLAISLTLAVSACSDRSGPSGPPASARSPATARPSVAERQAAKQHRVRAIGQLGPGRGTLVVSLRPPAGGKLTAGAPLVVEAKGENLRFPKRSSTRLDPEALPLRIPIDVEDGARGPAYVELSYYWCSDGDEKACRPEKTELVVDLDTTGDAPGGEAHLSHTATGG